MPLPPVKSQRGQRNAKGEKRLIALSELNRRVKCSLVQVPGEGVKAGYRSSSTGRGSRIPGSKTTSPGQEGQRGSGLSLILVKHLTVTGKIHGFANPSLSAVSVQ